MDENGVEGDAIQAQRDQSITVSRDWLDSKIEDLATLRALIAEALRDRITDDWLRRAEEVMRNVQ